MTMALFFSCGHDLGTRLLSRLAGAKITYWADKPIPDSGCPQTYRTSYVCALAPAVPNARVTAVWSSLPADSLPTFNSTVNPKIWLG